MEKGYGIELDVQVTRDGRAVVAHDYNLQRICGVDKDIDAVTYEELKKYPILNSQETVPPVCGCIGAVNGQVPDCGTQMQKQKESGLRNGRFPS